jgi:excisionase family DNA binding protein
MANAPEVSPEQIRSARQAVAYGRLADRLRVVFARYTPDSTEKVRLEVAGESDSFELPVWTFFLLAAFLEEGASGRMPTIAPANLPIGIETAARLAGVSRPWMATLIERGALQGVKSGEKRRVLLGSLMNFLRQDTRSREAKTTWEFLEEEEPADERRAPAVTS